LPDGEITLGYPGGPTAIMKILISGEGRQECSSQKRKCVNGNREPEMMQKRLNPPLLALKIEEWSHKPRNVSRLTKVKKAKKWIFS
jgi:hypothetical protein